MKLVRSLVAIAALLAATATTARAAGTRYDLTSPAGFSWGCFDPCACPVVSWPVKGDFFLTPRPPSPDPFQTYDVTLIDWVIFKDPPTLVTGSGIYRIGGEVALQHQLVLDLVVGDRPVQRFDSGIVAVILTGAQNTPSLDIDISLHGMTTCLDTAFFVRADPAVPSVIDAIHPITVRASPNPFTSSTDLALLLANRGMVDVTIHDLSGRTIRTLVRRRWFEAGLHPVPWDGLRDDGARAAAGAYFVRVSGLGDESSTKIVRF